MNRTGTIIVIIIGILLIAGGVWYVMQRNSTPTPPVNTTPPVATTTIETYASSTMGFSLSYPSGYTVNENYAYTQFPNKPIHGVSFTIPQSMATGTNLSTDTYLSVEELPNAKSCTGDIFITANVKPQEVTDGSVTYSVASSSDAGAGNRYEETVYALEGSKPCTAVRYYVHYSVLDNYPPGMVQAYNSEALMSDFDNIRRSIVLSR